MEVTPDPEQLIEKAGRTCYQSQDAITPESSNKFIKKLIKSGHESVLEHASITVKLITNRGVTHELVRHRTGVAYSQESTRYVKYDGDMEFIRPVWLDKSIGAKIKFKVTCLAIEAAYKALLKFGWRPEEAREILPNALKTEIVVTANIREWRHIFKLRSTKKAHPQTKALMRDVLRKFQAKWPALFEDI